MKLLKPTGIQGIGPRMVVALQFLATTASGALAQHEQSRRFLAGSWSYSVTLKSPESSR